LGNGRRGEKTWERKEIWGGEEAANKRRWALNRNGERVKEW